MEYANVEIVEKECKITLICDLFTRVQAGEIQPKLKAALDGGTNSIIFDFLNVKLIDSSGIGFLIAVTNSLSKIDGKIEVINLAPDLLALLSSMRLVSRLNAKAK